MKRTKLALIGMTTVAALLFGFTAPARAAVLTWTGGGNGHSWNGSGNWSGGTRPGTTGDTLHITTTDTIDDIYRGSGTSLYSGGSTWRGNVNLNQGTITLDHYFGTGSNGVFNIGDGVGTADAIFNVVNGGRWQFDRHSNGTYKINIKRDGQLNATGTGYFERYGGHNNRKWQINVDGGSVTSAANWDMSDGSGNDANRVNLSDGGTVDVGAITVHEEVIDFADYTGSFTADYGASFGNIGAVTAALGSTFTTGAEGELRATDNGGSFTVDVGALSPGGFSTIGTMNLEGNEQNLVMGPVPDAKFVRVVQNLTESLQVAELQVFEDGTGDNLALSTAGGSATAKDLGHGGTPDRANDGDTNMSWGGGSVWHSGSGQGTWLQIELADPADIDSVHFWGRSDCCHGRQGDFSLIVEDALNAELINERIVGLGSTSPYHGLIPLEYPESGEVLASLVSGETYVMEIGDMADEISVENPYPGILSTIVDLNGADLEIDLLAPPQPGIWQLFRADEIRGSYGSLMLPSLGSGMEWITKDLTVGGTLSITPEPTTVLIWSLLAGLCVGLRWRRRK